MFSGLVERELLSLCSDRPREQACQRQCGVSNVLFIGLVVRSFGLACHALTRAGQRPPRLSGSIENIRSNRSTYFSDFFVSSNFCCRNWRRKDDLAGQFAAIICCVGSERAYGHVHAPRRQVSFAEEKHSTEFAILRCGAPMTFTKNIIPWNVGQPCAAPNGPLTTEQVQHLSEKYGFGFAKIRQLSKELSGVLENDLKLPQSEFRQDRRDRAIKELDRAIKDLEKATVQLNKASAALDKIAISNPLARIGAENPVLTHFKNYSDGKAAIEDFLAFLRGVARNIRSETTDHAAFNYSVGHICIDKRRVKDVRREIVVTQIFNMWERSGRKLSYTTDPITSERRGELFEFVNDVVACITEPSTSIDTATIKKDLDDFKKYGASKNM